MASQHDKNEADKYSPYNYSSNTYNSYSIFRPGQVIDLSDTYGSHECQESIPDPDEVGKPENVGPSDSAVGTGSVPGNGSAQGTDSLQGTNSLEGADDQKDHQDTGSNKIPNHTMDQSTEKQQD